MKIVGIGLNKTGTTTLGVCLKHWGLKHISCSQDAFNLWRKEDYDGLLKLVGDFDSFEDWPWALIYKAIDERFPGAKFILTRRKDAETWFNSLCQHADRTGPTDYRKYIYGYEMPREHKAEHIFLYEKHLETVREYFRKRPSDFIEVCWEEGDGWKELSDLLDFECPNIPFPHANKSSAR
ncbi:MAG: hypothetical protein A3H31_03245 [Gallionellales bacterium RIFCSPLOWO2_02_FULL_57_47]|nr:MAG: hypothetical protein A3H31_03245 [Gallionellales bacterium RIFCSPLOWO2_02_FULL_57_47]